MLPARLSADSCLTDLASLEHILAPHGLILSLSRGTIESTIDGLESLISPLSDGTGYISLARPFVQSHLYQVAKNQPVLLVEQRENKLAEKLHILISRAAINVQRIALNDVTQASVPRGAIVISLLEAEDALLSSISDEQMSLLKVITNNSSIILWVTAGDVLNGRRPDFSLVSGLSRALTLE